MSASASTELMTRSYRFNIWELINTLCGITYFALWSFSFYPQIYLNWKRKSVVGFSPDFTYINPFGFLALTIWTWGAFFSPIARRQYSERHHGHFPQVSVSDLAFSFHALILSTITLGQSFYYSRRSRIAAKAQSEDEAESSPLIARDVAAEAKLTTPSLICQYSIAAIIMSSFGLGVTVWIGWVQFLDWLYYVSTLKLVISLLKYIPQIILNYKLKSTEGYSVSAVLCLVISAAFIDHQPVGIIANPAKLGLALLSLAFDVIMLSQSYIYRNRIQAE